MEKQYYPRNSFSQGDPNSTRVFLLNGLLNLKKTKNASPKPEFLFPWGSPIVRSGIETDLRISKGVVLDITVQIRYGFHIVLNSIFQ